MIGRMQLQGCVNFIVPKVVCLRKLVSSCIKKLVAGGFFVALIAAIMASVITTVGLSAYSNHSIKKEQLLKLSSVHIGSNKEWMDETFGKPQYVNLKEEYLLCAYIHDSFILQVAFNEGGSAKAYFITTLTSDKNIIIQDTTLMIDNNEFVINDFSYYEFEGSPLEVRGYISNGNARMVYGETYYYGGGGNYYEYHIATFDFGYSNGKEQWSEFPKYIDDEVNVDTISGFQVISNRKESYPNTFGVSVPDIDVDELLFSYDWFNSQHLRNDQFIEWLN